MNEGKKDDLGKPRFDLVPPVAEVAFVRVLEYGAKKYGDHNWKKVEDGPRRYFAAARRHLNAYARGEVLDPESGEPHLAHAICSLWFLLELEKA